MRISPLKLKLAAVLTASATVAALGVAAAPAGASGPTPHRMKVEPQISQRAFHPNANVFGCQNRPMDGSQGPRCYQPSQIQNAYNISPLLNAGKDGTGRTIVIIDAFGSPDIVADLQQFDQAMGLPDANFSQIAPAGAPPAFDPNDDNQVGWGIETTLDVEWAHAVAPGANIVLAIAPSNNDTDIFNVQKFVIQHNVGDVLSQSFGEAEQCMDPASSPRRTRCSSRPAARASPSSPPRATRAPPSPAATAPVRCARRAHRPPTRTSPVSAAPR